MRARSGGIMRAVSRTPTAERNARAIGLIGLLAAYLPAYTDRRGFWYFDGDVVARKAVCTLEITPAISASANEWFDR
jgi:hypothetical protein